MKYYLTIDGCRITPALTLLQIVKRYGRVQDLEKIGYRLVPV